MQKLYLVDASAMFFRAYYAIAPLSTSEGFPTQALHGFLNMSLKLLSDEKPDYMAYCFDRPEPSFRLELDANYKANRGEMPDDLSCQVPYMRPFAESLGITTLDKKNFEADDIIGTLTHQATQQGLQVVIVSGDKDFAQLISSNVTMYDTMKNIKYTPSKVVEKWGIQPEQMIDYLAIVGDSSDNITGIRGVGPKGACKLLNEHKSLNNILQLTKQQQPPLAAGLLTKIKQGEQDALLAQKLVRIKQDVQLDVQPQDLKLKPINGTELNKLLIRFEFQNLGKRLSKLESFQAAVDEVAGPVASAAPAAPAPVSQGGTELAAAAGSSDDLAPASATASTSTVSTDSTAAVAASASATALRVGEDNVVCGSSPWVRGDKLRWSLMDFEKNLTPGDTLWVVPYEKPGGEAALCFGHKQQAIELAAAPLAHLGSLLEHKQLRWKGYDLKNCWHMLNMSNPPAPVCDLMLAAYVLQAKEIKGLDVLQAVYGGRAFAASTSVVELINSCVQLEPLLNEKFYSTQHRNVYRNIELPLVPVLFDMERRGVLVDTQRLKGQEQHLSGELKNIEHQVYQQVGREFNLASPKQLGKVLFDDLQLKPVRKTKTGYSTDAHILKKISHPVVEAVLQHRELSKLLSTYVTALPKLVRSGTGRVHTHFMQATTATGRLSSRNPNLQNIPIRTAKGRQVREAFVADKGQVLVSIDYSQIELRVLAEITNDRALVQAFEQGEDVHTSTAALVFDTSSADVTPEQRHIAKAVNFGLAYGQGASSLAEQLKLKRAEAQKIIDTYFSRFSGVKDYMHNGVEQARSAGYVESLFGRRRSVPELMSKNPMLRSFGQRIAINAPIQSTASDLVKMAMLKVHSMAPLLLQVHDELIFECKKSSVQSKAKQIVQAMEDVGNFKVPLKAHAGWGTSWAAAH